MIGLVALCVGSALLLYLSQCRNPIEAQLEEVGNRHFFGYRADVFLVIAILWMTCFSFLRTSYNDTATYIFFWKTAPTTYEFIEAGGLLDWTGNPLSDLYQSVMHDLIDNYHIYFFFPAIANTFATTKLFKRYSVNPALSVLIFFAIGTYVMYIAAIKQSIALFFLLLSIPYAEEKKYVRFYLLVLVAILFHTHAFMFVILPLLFGKPWGKTTWAFLGLTLFGMVTYDTTFGAFMEFAQSIGALVAEIELFDGHQINILRVAVYWVPAILCFIFRKRLFEDSSRIENLFVNMSLVSAFILTLGLVQGANLFARMAAYFEVGMAIALPWLIQKLFAKESANLVSLIAGGVYFVYFLYEHAVSKSFGTDYAAITLPQFITNLFS